ncbi:MAG TPA: pyridoxamine 5'-phosphate oxidase family protein [Rubrivivax sp.]|jgi:pyridoxamine 5'-phosphate oxidase|nr:pyridoxamine 5'-phosphate oxidase family protein [Rubrivivax sp.]
MDARLDSLAEIEERVWSELQAAPRDAAHPWHVAVLATTDGMSGDGRSVVLRDVDAARRCIEFYTDARSPKLMQVQSHPRGTLVLWSEPTGWQLRLRVQLEAQLSGLSVSSRWARLKMTPAAHDYLSPLPPGSRIAAPGFDRGSRAYFAVVSAQVLAIDWLELHALGHRRALFESGEAHWLAP